MSPRRKHRVVNGCGVSFDDARHSRCRDLLWSGTSGSGRGSRFDGRPAQRHRGGDPGRAGYNCPDVKRMVDLGPDKWGSVLKITCGPVGRDETWDDRPLRVTAYAEGDFTTKPWPEQRLR